MSLNYYITNGLSAHQVEFQSPTGLRITDSGKFYCGVLYCIYPKIIFHNASTLCKCLLNVILQICKKEISPISCINECIAIAIYFPLNVLLKY